MKDISELKPGEECGHPGCKNHISHPCEGCGRRMAGLLHQADPGDPPGLIIRTGHHRHVADDDEPVRFFVDNVEEVGGTIVLHGTFPEIPLSLSRWLEIWTGVDNISPFTGIVDSVDEEDSDESET